MEAVCEVAKPTWDRNTTGPEGSPERAAWVCVYKCKYSLFSGPAWVSDFVFLHAWIVLHPQIQALHQDPPHLSLLLQMDTMDAWVGIALWEGEMHSNALACERLDMWQRRIYMSLCMWVFMFILGCFILRPTSQWFSMSVSLFPGTLLQLHQLCFCVCLFNSPH